MLQGANSKQPRKRLARSERAPTDRLSIAESEYAVDLAGLHEAPEAIAILRSFGLVPGLASLRNPRPHAPAAAARPIVAKELHDEGPVARFQRTNLKRRRIGRTNSFLFPVHLGVVGVFPSFQNAGLGNEETKSRYFRTDR
jgi:hypothetical protein